MKTLRSQKGMAIPTVLVSLVALTALGLALTISTQGEVIVSGAQQRAMQSFHAADGGINYSLGVAANFDDPSNTTPFKLDTLGAPFSTWKSQLNTEVTVGVTYLPPVRLPPPGLRVSALKVSSFHFRLDSMGSLPGISGQPASVTSVEMEASKLGPYQPPA
jgi:hypothetical protein